MGVLLAEMGKSRIHQDHLIITSTMELSTNNLRVTHSCDFNNLFIYTIIYKNIFINIKFKLPLFADSPQSSVRTQSTLLKRNGWQRKMSYLP